MKRVFFISFLFVAMFLFSSFILFDTSAKAYKSPKATGFPFKGEGTFTYSTTFYLCNGDVVDMTLTDNYKYHGTSNNNRFMIDVEDHYIGTGVDQATGEVYTLNTIISYHDNVPVSTKGAYVSRSIFNESIIGDQTGEQKVNITSHVTFNANGDLASGKSTFTSVCQ